MMKTYFTVFSSIIDDIYLVGGESGLSALHIDTGKRKGTFDLKPDWERNDTFFSDIVNQLKDYFSGVRKTFDIKLAPEGTEYQKKVWNELLKIPYGEVRSYGEIAGKMGAPGSARAVGMANGKNPIPVIIPCHRVIGSNGKLTGFAFGLDLKKRLLYLESESC